MTSPYANPGGFRCMYCGSQHSSRFDCRLPCSLCQDPGPPYRLEKEDGSFDLAVFCFEHEPSKEWKIQPCSPPQITNVIFDMETSDPDDFLTLCWLCSHPKVNLIGVTVTPGTQEQIGLIRRTLYECHSNTVYIGSFDSQRQDGCVSGFHYNIPGFKIESAKADGSGAEIIKDCLKKYPDATLLTGAPLKNLHNFLKTCPDIILQHWVAQGGFAGDSLVKPENRLVKFAGRETCPTFNFNGDPHGALLALSSNQIQQRTLVSKNVCHSISYDQKFHELFKPRQNFKPGMNLIFKTMEVYLQRHPKGKMLHDPLAACVMMQPDICEFEEVEVYRSKGEWGSKKSQNTKTKISISVDPVRFQETFLLLNMI